jgi:membrane protease subunit HflC
MSAANSAISKKAIFLIALLVICFIGVNSVFFTVDEKEQLVITRFGKPIRQINTAGLKMKVPFVDQLTYFDKRLLAYDSNPTEIITQDKKTLVVDNFSRWKIIDPLKFLQTVRNETGAQARLDDIIYSELRLELGRKDLIKIVASERTELMDTVTKASDIKARKYGIQIIDVRLKRSELPSENLKSIYGRMRTERNRIARQYRSEGAEEAQKIRAQTDRERDILLAEAYEKEQIKKGIGDAKSIDLNAKAFSQDPDFYAFLKSIDVYKESLKDKTTIVLPPDSEFLKFLYGTKK